MKLVIARATLPSAQLDDSMLFEFPSIFISLDFLTRTMVLDDFGIFLFPVHRVQRFYDAVRQRVVEPGADVTDIPPVLASLLQQPLEAQQSKGAAMFAKEFPALRGTDEVRQNFLGMRVSVLFGLNAIRVLATGITIVQLANQLC